MKGEWCYFRSAASTELCEKIISSVQSLPVTEAEVGSQNASENTVRDVNVRRTKIRFIPNQSQYSFVFDLFWKHAQLANDHWFNVQFSKLDYLQFAEYHSNERAEYREHHDVFWMNNDPKYHRKLSGILQLSDPSTYTGGNIEMTEAIHKPDASDLRTQGTLLFFPSMMRHQVTPVTQGVRYSVTAWFDGNKWS